MLLDIMTTTIAKHVSTEPGEPSRSASPANYGSFFSQMPLSVLSSVLRQQPADCETLPADTPKHPQTLMTTGHQVLPSSPTSPSTSPPTSRPISLSSFASNEEKPKKRGHRPKTTYNLAQPPSATRPKLHLRPKVLLQLHQVVPSRRPKPAYEVIPFSLLAPRSTRRLTKTFYSNSRDRLGPNDLLIIKAEEYGARDDDDKMDDEQWGARDVVGIICPAKDERGATIKTEVVMSDGACWEVTNLPNGSYEFGCTDEHGLSLKSRWVPKIVPARRVSAMSSTSLQPSPVLENRKFNFSTISASSRRHPVIATMTRTNIDVLDSYAMPMATSPTTPGYTPSGSATPLTAPCSISNANSFLDLANDRLAVKTDDALHKFIVLSGIWVAFSEGWSAHSSWARPVGPSPLCTSATFRPSAPRRSMSYVDSPRSASPASIIDDNHTLSRIFRHGSQKRHRNASLQAICSPASTQTSPPTSPQFKTRPGRSNSTGNADFNPRIGSIRKRFGLALEDQAVPETEEEIQCKRSTDLLHIKELVLSDSPSDAPIKSPNLAPIEIIEPPADVRSSSPLSIESRAGKTQSAYNPVTTTGLWDSGVVDGPGLKRRPTSLVIVNGIKEKAKRKQEKSKSKKSNHLEVESHGSRRSLKECLKGLFHRDKN